MSSLADTTGWIVPAFLAVIVALVLVVVLLIVANRKVRRIARAKIDAVYERLADDFGLSEEERLLLEHAARHLSDDEPLFVLLTNPKRFAACIQSVKRSLSMPEAAIDTLRSKLHFSIKEAPVAASTADVTQGDHAVILLRSKKLIRGRVVDRGPRSLQIDIKGTDELPPVDEPVKLFVKRSAGIFTFETTVSEASDRRIHLRHSRSGERYQRRGYLRRDTPIPVLVKELGKEDPYLASTLIDLSGGGASMENPDMAFRSDDHLHVYFSSEEHTFTLPARVVRASDQGSVLHVEFDSIDDVTRDRLISTIV